MPPTPHPDRQLLRETVRDALQSPLAPYRALWKKFGYTGIAGLTIAMRDGGSGHGVQEAVIVMEEIGRHGAASPFLSSTVTCAALLAQGTPIQRGMYLPAIAAGDVTAVLAVGLEASRSGNTYLVAGRAVIPPGEAHADLVIAPAREPDGAITTFILPPSAICWDADRLTVAGFEAAGAMVIGEPRATARAMRSTLAARELALAAQRVGLAMQSAHSHTALERERAAVRRAAAAMDRQAAATRAAVA
jgi:alkylation response protein AidB-like acyl-CoA dehydrogenase